MTKIDPGCGVDIPCALYSLSFAPNPKYSKWYPERSEILEYMRNVAVRFDVNPRIILNITVKSTWWQEESRTWNLLLKDVVTGQTFSQRCSLLISATGTFVQPNVKTVEGLEGFDGPIVHTADWRDDVELDGKKVVVVGNGCASIKHIIYLSCLRTCRLCNSARSSARWQGRKPPSFCSLSPILRSPDKSLYW